MKKSLFGYAKTTKAIAKSGSWCIYDDNFKQASNDEYGNKLLPVGDFNADESELEIPSPGFAPNHELIKSAKHLISEYDYFLSDFSNKFYPFDNKICAPSTICISGTNGKTTTTQMCEHLLAKNGAVMGGNIGIPLADLNPSAKLWILETSSFTLHYTKHASPDIYALLPITPDHLSWHGDFQKYQNDKLKPLSMMKEGTLAIIPKIYENFAKNSLAKIYFYENESHLCALFGLDLNKINFKTPFLLDALMALSLQKILLDSVDYELINTFKIEENKLEEFSDFLGRTWVNDTKATNIDASICAIKRYNDKQILIILGGDDKGVDLSPVFMALKNCTHSPRIYAIGTNTHKIIEYAHKYALFALPCERIELAVKAINADFTDKNQIALLSPACASLDQFSSYEKRGQAFKNAINALFAKNTTDS